MKSQLNKPLSLLLLCSFALQLLTLSPTFSLPTVNFGVTDKLAEAEDVLLPKTIHEASLAVKNDNKKDTLIFTGDVMLARNVEWLMNENGNDFPYQKFSFSVFGYEAAVVGNFEAAMPAEHVVAPPLSMRFSVHPRYLSDARKTGFTHMSLANNHSFDYGNEGYFNAVSMIQDSGIDPFGNAREVTPDSVSFIETNAGVVALVGLNASDRIPDFNQVEDLMNVVKSRSDLQIIYIHWGTEYETTHSEVQEVIAKALVAEGADLIIGHHPHVVQDIQIVDGVVVLYSLGNFIFDQYFSEEVMQGLVASVNLVDEPAVSLFPVTSVEHHSQPALMDLTTTKTFLDDLAIRSDQSLKESILQGKIKLKNIVATSAKDAIILR